MRAWEVFTPGPIDHKPLRRVERTEPEPAAGEVRIKVSACGICRTDLHIAEGDLPVHRPRVVPGHEVVGTVDRLGENARRFEIGDRIGIPWLRQTCGRCPFCEQGRENLCLNPRFTGWDDDGGYAEYAVAPEDYAYLLPLALDDERVAPLLCAGIIGYRALRRAGVASGGRLGIYGFGGSAHIAAQVALHEGATVHVVTRSARARDLARGLGASAFESPDALPDKVDAAILFAPSGDLVPRALAALDRGGRLAVAGIHLTPIPPLDYWAHLFQERELVSVTANTRRDGQEFLELAARIRIEVRTVAFALDEADRALQALAHQQVTGAAVLLTD